MPARKSVFTRSTQFKRKLTLLSHREKYYRQVAFEEVLFLIHHATMEQGKALLAASASGSSIIPDSHTFQASDSYADWLLLCKHLGGTQRALSIFGGLLVLFDTLNKITNHNTEGAICFAGKIIPEAERAGWIASCQTQMSELRRLTSEHEDAVTLTTNGQTETTSPSLSAVLSRVPELTAYDVKSTVAIHPRRYGPFRSPLNSLALQHKLSDGDLYEGLDQSFYRKQEITTGLVSLTQAATLTFAKAMNDDFVLKLVVSQNCGNAIALALKGTSAALKKCLGEFIFTGMDQSRFCQKDAEYYEYAVQVHMADGSEKRDHIVYVVLSFKAGVELADVV